MCWQLTLLQTHWYIHIVYALRKWEGRWWTCGQFPAVVVATKRARAKHCYKKTCQLRELPGIPQDGTCYLFVPWLSLLPLTCLLTPDPVTSPYWCHAAPTVHAQIAFRVHLELISEDTHSCLQTYGGCMCQPSYCMYVNAYSQYIYIYTYRSKTDNYSVKLLVVSHSSAVPQHMPFHHFLFVHGDTAHSFLVHTGAVPYTQGANQTQTVGQILLDLVCCVTNRLSGSLRLRPQRPLKSSSAIFYNTWQLHMHYLAPCGWLWTKKIRLYVFFFGCQCELPPCLRAYGM